MTDWTRNDELWEAARQSMFPEPSFGAAAVEVAAILGFVAADAALDVLDLPCGPGRHSLVFASTGHRVVAVDLTRSYLDEAQERAEARAVRLERPLDIEFVRADIREFVRPGAFDLVVNLFTSIGFFRDINEDRGIFRNFRRSLRDGGRLVIDVMSREILAGRWQSKDWTRLADGTVMLQERRITDDWTWIEVIWTYIRDGREKRFEFGHRIYGVVDLKRELLDAGFSDVTVLGGYDGRSYDQDAERLIAVARA
jgi:SAM-dependent methyltransferase